MVLPPEPAKADHAYSLMLSYSEEHGLAVGYSADRKGYEVQLCHVGRASGASFVSLD
jgi:hypothetical protein